jgi:hypothetical protein
MTGSKSLSAEVMTKPSGFSSTTWNAASPDEARKVVTPRGTELNFVPKGAGECCNQTETARNAFVSAFGAPAT